LLRIVAPHMRRVISLVLRSRTGDVDDVLQEAMLGFLRALPAFRGECKLTSYATRIAARAAMAARRRSRTGAHDEFDETAHPIPSNRNPEAISASEKRQTLMLQLLDSLPAEQAETLGLRVVLGLSLQEVAEATGVPLNTVRSRVRLAKEALRERILSNAAYAEALGETA
jgi:RNA polymerase sigma-70 factor (ECF subfamily)